MEIEAPNRICFASIAALLMELALTRLFSVVLFLLAERLAGAPQIRQPEAGNSNLREAKARLRTIADPILAQAGGKKISRAQEREQVRTQQERNSRMETKGGTSTSLPKSQTPADLHELIALFVQARRFALLVRQIRNYLIAAFLASIPP